MRPALKLIKEIFNKHNTKIDYFTVARILRKLRQELCILK